MVAAHDQFGGVRQCHTRAWPWRPSSLPGGPLRGRLRRLGCAVWLRHAATVTSYVRMRSSSGRRAPVPVTFGRWLGYPELAACHQRGCRVPAGSAVLAEQWPCTTLHYFALTCYITVCNVSLAVVEPLAASMILHSWQPADGIYSLMALFVFSFGHSADDRSSFSSGLLATSCSFYGHSADGSDYLSFSLGRLLMTWQSPFFLTLLPLTTALRLQPFR